MRRRWPGLAGVLLVASVVGCSSSSSPSPATTGTTSTGTVSAPGTTAPDYAAVVRSGGPVAYWRLDEATSPAARDSSAGGRFVARYAGDVVTGEPPAVEGPGTSVRLDGRGAFVDVLAAEDPDAADLAPKDAMSVELWFSPDLGTTLSRVLLARWRWYGWGLAVDGGRVTAGVWQRSGQAQPVELTLVGPETSDGWHHVVLTRDATSTLLFVDGVLVDDVPSAGRLFATAVPRADDCCGTGGGVALGRDGDSPAGYFTGWLDEVAVYDRALSAAEVAEHFSYAVS